MFSILYVDDEPALLDITRHFLEKTGEFSILTTESAPAALSLLQSAHVDAIVSDYQMPVMDGIAFLKTVRERHGDLPFILFTGKGREEVVIEAINNGADSYIQKGGDPRSQFAELAHKISKAIENRQALAALKESELRFRSLFEQSTEPQLLLDSSGTVSDCNNAFLTLFALPDKRVVIGHGPEEFAPPVQPDGTPSPERGKEILREVLRTGSARFEWAHQKHDADRTLILTELLCTLIPLAGQPMMHIAIRDLTDRIRAEDALRAACEQLAASEEELRGQYDELAQSEQRIRESEAEILETATMLEALFNAIPDVIGIQDPRHGIIRYNQAGYAMVGQTPQTVIGKKCFELIGHDSPCPVCATSETYQTKRPAQVEKYVPELGVWLDVRSYPVLDPDGRIRYVIEHLRDITGRKTTEEALRESEEKYRALVETTSDFIWEVNDTGTYTYVSPKVHELLGYEPAELIGKTPFDLMPQDEAERVAAEFNRCIASQQPITTLLNRNIRKDGSTVILETSGIPRFDKNGRFAGYRGIDRDITGRTRLEERLARINEGLLHLGPDHQENIRALSTLCGELLGADCVLYNKLEGDLLSLTGQWNAPPDVKTRDAAEGHICYDVIRGNGYGPLVVCNLPESRYATTDPNVAAYGLKTYLGHPVMYGGVIRGSLCAVYTRDIQPTPEDQKIIGILSTAVAQEEERKESLEALRESEEKFRVLFDNQQNGIMIIDSADHRIVDVNPYMSTLVMLPKDQIVGRICHTFVCPAEEGRCPVTDLGQNVDTAERVLLTASGAEIPVLKTVVPVSLGGRNVLVESFIDISDQKRSEAAIREANRKLNLLNSITRHDVANQVTVLRGYTQLAQYTKPEPVVAGFLTKIADSVDTIQRQIDFTKLYQELGMHTPSWQNVGGVVGNVRSGTINLTCTCDSYEIYADPMLGKVFSNLFDNAVRHGQRVTEIAVRCDPAADELVITVEDNGTGIPLNEKQKIFEKGYGRNTGFGLFLAREILAITGISIHETGLQGRGARFELHVPPGTFRPVS